jgi:hypothetical protein
MRCVAATIPGRQTRTGKLELDLRRGILALAGALVLCAAPAAAGPWAREDGAVFLSVMLSAEEPRADVLAGRFETDPSVSIYGELGLGHGLTAGLELDWGTSSAMGGVFARYTLTAPSSPGQVAIDAGLAQRSVDGQGTDLLYRVGASLGGSFGAMDGRGGAVALLPGGGWVALDGAAFFLDDGTLSIWRTEATLGVHMNDRLRAIFALKAEEWPQNAVSVTARPSLVLRLSDGTSLQGGLVAGLRGSDALGVSLSLWREF